MASLEFDIRKIDVELMAQDIFGRPYAEISKIVYPRPKYKYFVLPKKSGEYRSIVAPSLKLKNIQESLLDFLQREFPLAKSCVHGFHRGRSVVTNAQAHCNRDTSFVLNIDLEDFFPSISYYRVRGVFENSPFGYARNTASALAHICCNNGILAQGAPTSPIISNLICRGLDKDLSALARKHRAIYTRYCDDITFSFKSGRVDRLPASICKFDGDVLGIGDELTEIISSHGFRIKHTKNRISSRQRRMEVTGIVINKFPNVRRLYVDKIRGALHAWETYGYEMASKIWEEKKYSRSLRTGAIPRLYKNLYGKLLYLKMVKGDSDDVYRLLAMKYNRVFLKSQSLGELGDGKLLSLGSRVVNASHVKSAVFVIHARWGLDELGLPEEEVQGTIFCLVGKILITCSHVIEKPEHIKTDTVEYYLVEPTSGKEHRLNLICNDSHKDIAVLRFVEQGVPDARELVLSEQPISQNADVMLYGFPNWTRGRALNSLPGTVTSTFIRSNIDCLEVDCSIRQGNSGGPLLNVGMRLVGMATQGADVKSGNNECVTVSEIRDFILRCSTSHPLHFDKSFNISNLF
ncbi:MULTISPECIES: reverse transcriptase domain-containing protein [Delftia]|uniref:reverse transcriptase domain-containing protein n=1 Tax=Delftia TaxID=80865 RepID=UPI001FCC5EFD|nr:MULTISPECIES: reverse transcriptase domain-containing protein [Delftia]BDE73160.1 hypothetical protein HQS1_42840 [Delftia lacustris]